MKKIISWFAGILADEIKKRLLEADAKTAILNLQPGDTIILRFQSHLSDAAFERIKLQMEEMFPGHRALILEEALEIFAARHEAKIKAEDEAITFICPSCKRLGSDQFITNSKIGGRVRCPYCKHEFNYSGPLS